ncbi:MAG: L-threonine 3-dehydrogenase [Thermoplasmata archaeon]
MKAIVKSKAGHGNTEMKKVSIPKVGPNDALVRMEAVSICGTDVHIYEWDEWAANRIKPPLIYGHEFCGYVERVGSNVDWIEKGDRVSGECHIYCGRCFQCRTGNAHICENMKIFGVDSPGIFAEYASLPAANLLENGELPAKYYSIQDPLGNAVHTVFATDVPGRFIAVLGLGPIGLMSVAVCKAVGAAKVFGIGRKNRYRIELGKKCGADFALSSLTDDVEDIVKKNTEGRGVDAVLEMTGNPNAINMGLDLLRPGGTIALLGVFAKPWTTDVSQKIVFKYTTVKGINGRLMFDTWYRMRGLMESGNLNLDPVITHELDFDAFEEGMDAMRSGNSGKVVLYMD